MPATSHSVVAKNKPLLLYAMSKGLSINVGRVINEEMCDITNLKKKTQAIGFPFLITQLCLKAGLNTITYLAERVPLMSVLS